MTSSDLSESVKGNVVQEYVKCNTEKRFLLLNTLLRKNVDKKVLVFCSSISILNFLTELLQCFKISVVTMHENMSPAEQGEILKEFSDAKESTMLCTDKCVLPLDTLNLDWFVQYDPPSSFVEYVKLLKSLKKSTHNLLFLQPDELGFLSHLNKKKISSNEFELKWSKVSNVQAEVEKLTSKVYAIHMAATEAYKAFVKFYAGHSMKKVFDVASLDLTLTAKSFGLKTPPFVDIDAIKSCKKRSIENDSEDVPVKKPKLMITKVLQAVKAKRSKKHK